MITDFIEIKFNIKNYLEQIYLIVAELRKICLFLEYD